MNKTVFARCLVSMSFCCCLFGQTYQATFESARGLLRQQRYNEAFQEARRATQIDSSQWGAYFVGGTALVGLEKQSDAISWFQAALARAPEQAKPSINQAIAACQQIVSSRSQQAPKGPYSPPQYDPQPSRTAPASIGTVNPMRSSTLAKFTVRQMFWSTKTIERIDEARRLSKRLSVTIPAQYFVSLNISEGGLSFVADPEDPDHHRQRVDHKKDRTVPCGEVAKRVFLLGPAPYASEREAESHLRLDDDGFYFFDFNDLNDVVVAINSACHVHLAPQ
jgi:tetratricopeptide (TPR) repeat protein